MSIFQFEDIQIMRQNNYSGITQLIHEWDQFLQEQDQLLHDMHKLTAFIAKDVVARNAPLPLVGGECWDYLRMAENGEIALVLGNTKIDVVKFDGAGHATPLRNE